MNDSNPQDESLGRWLRLQRRYGQTLVLAGMLGLVLSPAAVMYGHTLVPESSSGELSDEEVAELEDAIASEDFGTVAEYWTTPMDHLLETSIQMVVYGLPAMSLLLLLAGGFIVISAEKNGHRLDLESYPENPNVRDEFRNDE